MNHGEIVFSAAVLVRVATSVGGIWERGCFSRGVEELEGFSDFKAFWGAVLADEEFWQTIMGHTCLRLTVKSRVASGVGAVSRAVNVC